MAEEGRTDGPPIIEIFNKIDAVAPDDRKAVIALAKRTNAIVLSAITGEGIDLLGTRIVSDLGGSELEREVILDAADGETIAWLHRNARVLDQQVEDDDRIRVQVRLSAANNARLVSRLAGLAEN
jgi:GTP-binding protein HflX